MNRLHRPWLIGAMLLCNLPAPAQTPLYACPVGQGEAVYASEPLNVDCQPAKRQQPAADALAAAQTDATRRLWYQNEFGRMDDVHVLPRQSAPKVHIRLRPQPAAKRPPPRPAATPPPPKPLTPKQLILRDIASEQRALSRTQQQLQRAQQQNNATQIRALQQNAADREANIRALQQELQRP